MNIIDKVRIFLNNYVFKFFYFRITQWVEKNGKFGPIGIYFPISPNAEKNSSINIALVNCGIQFSPFKIYKNFSDWKTQ